MEEPRFCDTCRVWLNCENQYKDHLGGRMHKKKLDQKRLESSSTAAPSEADHLTFGPETHLHMLEVTPREDLAAIGNAARLIQRAFRRHRGIGMALAAP